MDDEYHPIGDSFSIRRGIGHGFTGVRIAAGPMWVGGFLISLSDGCSGPPGDLGGLMGGGDEENAAFALPARVLSRLPGLAQAAPHVDTEWLGWLIGVAIAFVVGALLVGAALFALNSYMQTGFIRMHVHVITHASDQLGPLFSGKDRFWHMAGYKALSGLALSGALIAAVWPGALLAYLGHANERPDLLASGVFLMMLLGVPALIYVGLGVYLGEHAVALEGAAPVQALRRAWALARGNRLPLFAFAFVCLLIELASFAGFLLCCVGVLATVPFARSITGLAKTEGFVLMTGGFEQSAGFRLWHGGGAPARVQGPAGPEEPPPPQQPAEPPGERPPDADRDPPEGGSR